MQIKKKNLDPEIQHKRELIDSLYTLIHEGADLKEAYYDLEINEKKPRKSRIIANRPGIQLLASEMLLQSEMLFDDWDEGPHIQFGFIDAGKKSQREARFRISELEIVDYQKHKNSMAHNSTTSFNASFSGIFWAIVGFSIFLLSLFGLIAVIRFFMS